MILLCKHPTIPLIVYWYVIYACMYVCVYVSMFICMYVCMYVCMDFTGYECIYVCMYVCTYSLHTYSCTCICICLFVHKHGFEPLTIRFLKLTYHRLWLKHYPCSNLQEIIISLNLFLRYTKAKQVSLILILSCNTPRNCQ